MPSDFSLSKVPTIELPEEHWTSGLFTRVGIVLDGVLMRAMSFMVDSALSPDQDRAETIRATAEPYLSEKLQNNPRLFFDFLDKMPDRMPVPVSERFRRTVDGGVVVARQFLSNYKPYFEGEGNLQDYVENERIPVEHWMHEPERPRATVLALHGFTMGYPSIDAFVLMASEWFKRGLDVALMALPYHGSRSPRSARFSGEAFASPDVVRLNEAVRQAVSDVHMLTNWFRERTKAPVGLLGLSLGGYVSSLVAGLTKAPAFVIPLVPPVDMADMAGRFYESSRYKESELEHPLDREIRDKVYRIHSPLTFALQLPRENALIVAGRGDRVVPTEHPQALWLHWEKPDIYWFSGSHVAPFGRRRIIARIVDHLGRIGVL